MTVDARAGGTAFVRGEHGRRHRGEAPNVRVAERKLGGRHDAGTDTDQHQAEIARAFAEPRSRVGGRAELAGAIGFVTLPVTRVVDPERHDAEFGERTRDAGPHLVGAGTRGLRAVEDHRGGTGAEPHRP